MIWFYRCRQRNDRPVKGFGYTPRTIEVVRIKADLLRAPAELGGHISAAGSCADNKNDLLSEFFWFPEVNGTGGPSALCIP